MQSTHSPKQISISSSQQSPQQSSQQYPQQYPQQSSQQSSQQSTQQFPQQSTQQFAQQSTQQFPQQSTQQFAQQSTQQYPQQSTQQFAQQYPQQSTQQYPQQSTQQYTTYRKQSEYKPKSKTNISKYLSSKPIKKGGNILSSKYDLKYVIIYGSIVAGLSVIISYFYDSKIFEKSKNNDMISKLTNMGILFIIILISYIIMHTCLIVFVNEQIENLL
jgi:hypothetical protein